MLSNAVPIEPPTCWVALTRALATPASCGATPIRAVLLNGTKANPSPMLTLQAEAGRTCVT